MATIPLVSTTGVVSGTAGYNFVFESENYWRVTVTAYGLGAAERATIYMVVANGALVAAVNETGTEAVIDDSLPQGPQIMVGGPTYMVVTDSTVAPTSISISPCNRP